VEVLEDRCLLAIFTVMNLNDSGTGSLRAAVTDANNMAGADEIVFSSALLNTSNRTIELTSGQLTITGQVSIRGPEPTAEGILISGTDASRVFEVTAAASNVRFSFLTVTQGDAGPSNGGGGLLNQGTGTIVDSVTFVSNSARDGGAISNTGQGLQVHRSLITGNTAVGFGGGGIFNSGTALISDSTLSENQLTGMGGGGGAVCTSGNTQQLQISGCTIIDNRALSAVGGGVFNFSLSTSAMSLNNSTVARNVALGGGGIQTNAGTVTLANLTIVGNIELSDLSGTSGGLGRIGSNTVNSTNTIISGNLSPGPKTTSMPLPSTAPTATTLSGAIPSWGRSETMAGQPSPCCRCLAAP
jgi:predicted outer membrane repeat protein